MSGDGGARRGGFRARKWLPRGSAQGALWEAAGRRRRKPWPCSALPGVHDPVPVARGAAPGGPAGCVGRRAGRGRR